eukprot:TRINITY_DN939_c0_g2_i3.p1 TRINITY_DN939_c0_g2~~TRINITY_DN939_c0_g2_i3.p1  ORF type:complete len:280 (+),score=48.36 TRINITY_DN939_c0_g2_i3:1532-2371(+)
MLREYFANDSLLFILSYLASLIPQSVPNLVFVKTPLIINYEFALAERARGIIRGYRDTVTLCRRESTQKIPSVQNLLTDIANVAVQMHRTQMELSKLDKDELISMVSIPINEGWSFWKGRVSKEVPLIAPHKITLLQKSPGDWSEDVYSEDRKQVTTTLTSPFWGKCIGSVTAYTTFKIQYAQKIRDLKNEREKLNQDNDRLEIDLIKQIGEDNVLQEKIVNATQSQAKTNKLIGILKAEFYTLDQVAKLLEKTKNFTVLDEDALNHYAGVFESELKLN